MNVTVIGTGYVGLTTGVTLAYLGHNVTCLDVDEEKISKLRKGISPIYEPGLESVMNLGSERLNFVSDYGQAIPEADVIFLAVGTPANEDGSPNLSYLNSAFETCIAYIRQSNKKVVLINKSTVPVGTAERFQQRLILTKLDSRVTVASNPEFLRQGRAMHDTLYPDRIVIGGGDFAIDVLKELYAPLTEQAFTAPKDIPRPNGLSHVPLVIVDRSSAELGKYAANAFLAMKISFINEIASVCDKVQADVNDVAKIIGSDPRIGHHFLQAGIGYGGSCFPKDTRALRYIAKSKGYSFKLMNAVIEINNKQKYIVISKLQDVLGELDGKKIAVLGLTFKPETDDLREAPSIPIIKTLVDEGAEVSVHDPVALNKASAHLPENVFASESIEEVVDNADAIVLLTEWKQYKDLDWAAIARLMENPVLIDGRNALDAARIKAAGFDYYGVGRCFAGNREARRKTVKLNLTDGNINQNEM